MEVVIIRSSTHAIAHTFPTMEEAAIWYATKDSAGVFDSPLSCDERDILIRCDIEKLDEMAGQVA